MMDKLFKTDKPISATIAKYVAYYYIDFDETNIERSFYCFPHYNCTISFHKSHKRIENKTIFKPNSKPSQYFTPIRQKIHSVQILGPVQKITIVFNPLGVQQFFPRLDITQSSFNCKFVSMQYINDLFNCKNHEDLPTYLDQMLLNKLSPLSFYPLEEIIHEIHGNTSEITVQSLSEKYQMSRRHLNRLFNQNLGLSVKSFIQIVRFRHTVDSNLLNNTDLNLTDIAYLHNFSDQSHLIKLYKKLTQMPPKKFVEKGQKFGDEDIFWHIK